MTCEKCNREIPFTHPYCSSDICLTKVILGTELAPEGGFLTHIEGFKYPLRAYPTDLQLHFVDVLKRVLISTPKFIAKFPFTIKRLLKATSEWMGEIYSAAVRPYERRPLNHYSQSSREILRVLLKLNTLENDLWVYYLVDIWETDMAYRCRGQDIFPMVDKKALKNNPRREIMRLVELAIERENNSYAANETRKRGMTYDGVLPKLRLIRNIVRIALFSPRIKGMVIDFFTELNLDEIKLDVSDRYWVAPRFDYNYEGKTYEERMARRNEEDKNWTRPAIPPQIPHIGINPPNQAFYDLNEFEAQKMANKTAKALMENWKQNQHVAY